MYYGIPIRMINRRWKYGDLALKYPDPLYIFGTPCAQILEPISLF
jgi:hypothetical protein